MKHFIEQFGPSVWPWIILTYEVWKDMCMEISADRVVAAMKKYDGEGLISVLNLPLTLINKAFFKPSTGWPVRCEGAHPVGLEFSCVVA